MQPASTAQDTPTQPFQDEGPNALSTDMTDDELTAFVDKTLGPAPTVTNAFGNASPLPTPNEIAKDTNDEKPTEEEKPSEPEKPAEQPPAPAQPTQPEQEHETPTEIPDVDSSDLWIEFEGMTVDAEGKAVSKTYRVGVDDELPADVRFSSDKQLFEVMDAMREMRETLAQRQAEHDNLVEEAEKQTTDLQGREQTIAGWNNEIANLVEVGLLESPKAPAKDPSKGYTPEEVAADPALQRIDAIFNFMNEENTRRSKEGKAPLASFGTAFNLFQNKERQDKDAEEARRQDEETKRKGAMIGGGGGAQASSGKGYVYKAGSAKSVYDVDTSDL